MVVLIVTLNIIFLFKRPLRIDKVSLSLLERTWEKVKMLGSLAEALEEHGRVVILSPDEPVSSICGSSG